MKKVFAVGLFLYILFLFVWIVVKDTPSNFAEWFFLISAAVFCYVVIYFVNVHFGSLVTRLVKAVLGAKRDSRS